MDKGDEFDNGGVGIDIPMWGRMMEIKKDIGVEKGLGGGEEKGLGGGGGQ